VSKLRPYQQDAVEALEKDLTDGLHCLGISLPTGTGKTHIMAELGRRGADDVAPFDGPGRVLFLLHRDTLVEQTANKLRASVSPGTSIGILKAERNETGARIIIASVHSLRSEARRRKLPPIKLVIVDEAHVSVSSTYKAVFRQLGVGTPGGPIMVGFSATWTRSDDTGLGDVWEKISYTRTIKWAVTNGHLVPPRAIQVGAGVDLSEVRTSRSTGDYRDDDLGKAVMLEELRDSVVNGVLKHAFGRPAALFAPTVEAAEYFGDALRAANISTAGIYGVTPHAVRRQRFAAHREGSIKVLTTCTALAEGWDEPPVSLILLVRPTKHEGLFVQIFGRALRPWPGKADALLLDFVGATDNVKLRNAVDLGSTVLKDNGTELEELIDDELEETEIVERVRTVRQRKSSYEVELFAGTSVQWLMGPANIPFVPCGDGLVFIVEDARGWNVAQTTGEWIFKPELNRSVPQGKFLFDVLASQEDALELASEFAEEHGQYIAKRSAAWRTGKPSAAQIEYAAVLGIGDAENMSRGALSDTISVVKASGVLSYFAAWSRSQLMIGV
jgi:superfamily II DNA or RNA helicase